MNEHFPSVFVVVTYSTYVNSLYKNPLGRDADTVVLNLLVRTTH